MARYSVQIARPIMLTMPFVIIMMIVEPIMTKSDAQKKVRLN